MKKWMKKISRSILVLMCVGTASLCTAGKNVQASQEEAGAVQSLFQKAGNETAPDAEEEKNYLKKQMEENRERFFEEAQRQGIGSEQAEKLFGRLLEDKIFQNGALALTGLRLDDIDGNGQMDMLLMVQDAEQIVFYGSGSLWFYMNEDTPYCFDEEECSYYGIFDVFWADVDNDENVEIVFSAEGFGCGAVGDSYKAVFKYENHTMERMELPSDLENDYDCGLVVDVIQEPEADSYSAYCPYLDELILFGRENGCPPPETAEAVGGNARGFYNLSLVKYEGKNVLQASEYLYGEGGVADCAAIAQFLITWEEDGTPVVLKWWIEEAF